MGGRSSTRRRYASSGASSCNYNTYPQSPYHHQVRQHPYYKPQHHHAPPSHRNYGGRTPQPHWRIDQKYSMIADDYTTLEQVTAALAQAGLESSNLIVGIDFTKSNEWTGSRSFHHRSLHHIGNSQNPYEQAISIVGKTLSAFDEDNLIPCFGFGDASTRDEDVFSFYPDAKICCGFEQVLKRYRELVPNLQLSGPTSFAPIIEMAMKIVEESRGQYHVLLIIADGQVTTSTDAPIYQCSTQEQKTIEAIVRASEYPLSIILVGVGDGPWDMMREFDDNIPSRMFDNFQFVNFTEIMSKNENSLKKETEFALAALMEIPSQYQATIALNLLGHQTGNAPDRDPCPPPSRVTSQTGSFNSHSSNTQQYSPLYHPQQPAPLSISLHDNKVCPICQHNPKDMAFNCGHQTCCDCGLRSQTCPTCSNQIITKIKLY